MQGQELRQIPHNVDAEQAVLAAMLLDKAIVEEALAQIDAGAFFRAAHQKIFAAIAELNQDGTPVDQLTLADKLEARGELGQIGGKAYILELANNSFAIANWESHAKIIKNDALLRDLVYAADHIKSLGVTDTDNAMGVVEEAEKLIFDVTNKRISSNFRDVVSVSHEVMDVIEMMARNKTHLFGVPSGFRALDDRLGGMRGGDLIILAARPGVGKTSFALNMITNAARAGTSVAFFSLEMPAVQLVMRILSAEAMIDNFKLKTGNVSETEVHEIIKTIDRLGKCQIAIDDSMGITILELRAKARRQLRNAEKNKGIVVVDYLQLVSSRGPRVSERHLEVAEITRGLKSLAKDLDVPVLALSQLSRAAEMRADKRPLLSDLRESGSIEQDADVVLFIERTLRKDDAPNKDAADPGIAKLIIAKNRNGSTAQIDLKFIPEFTSFRDMAVER
ncbi:MAG: replicative DNA helicase [Coriobacteriales bacterium]|jgi:replicative DNA helicase|nr:replicative DNA helicase [Coriobacteriales bacterium]